MPRRHSRLLGDGGGGGLDHLGEGVAEGVQAVVIHGLRGLGALDVKRVDGDAALGADAGKGDVEAVVGNGLGQPVEQADLVARLDFDDGARHRELVVDLDRRREGGVQALAGDGGAGGGDALGLGDDVGEEVLVAHEGGLDGVGKDFLGPGALDDAAVGFDDVERVDGDVVGAGDDLGTEDGEAGDAEGPGELVEEAGAVPG